MHAFLRFLAALCAIACGLTITLAIVLHAAGTRLARSEPYKQALIRADVYQDLPGVVGETLTKAFERRAASGGASGSAQDELAAAVARLKPDDWAILLRAVAPSDYLRTETERALDSAADYLHGQDSAEAGVLSLVELKRRLTDGTAAQGYRLMLAAKPECAGASAYEAAGIPIDCRPPADQMASVLDLFGQVTASVAEQLPDRVDLLQGLRKLEGPEGTDIDLAAIHRQIRRGEWIASWSPIVPAGFALLIALFAIRSLRGALLWWGIPCFIGGGITLLAALTFALMGATMVRSAATSELPADVPIHTVQTIMVVLNALVQQLIRPAIVSAGVVTGAGLLALVLAIATRSRAASPPPAPPPIRSV